MRFFRGRTTDPLLTVCIFLTQILSRSAKTPSCDFSFLRGAHGRRLHMAQGASTSPLNILRKRRKPYIRRYNLLIKHFTSAMIA